MRLALACLLIAGCVDSASEAPTAPNQLRGDDKADGDMTLWAGLTSVTFERYTTDPCDDGRFALGDDPAVYDEWVRERAGIRNICFEVWSPGITDWDNPDFWQQLDVQVHYRFGDEGEFQHAYVNSIDRRGNNRRYAWSLDYSLDPFGRASTVPTIPAPFKIISESATYITASADLEFYFTVNGRTLDAPSSHPFTIEYQGYARKPTMTPNPDGNVLHDIVTCEGGTVRIGTGAGFFATDIRSPAAIADLAGDTSNTIYGIPLALANGGQLLEMSYGSQIPVAGQTLPGFSDFGGLRMTPDGTDMTIELDVYDRTLGKVRTLSTTVGGCVAAGATN